MLTVAVVLQLLESSAGKPAARLIASAVGVLMLLEGAIVLLRSSRFADDAGQTTAAHGIALVVAGAGVWALSYRILWTRVTPAVNCSAKKSKAAGETACATSAKSFCSQWWAAIQTAVYARSK
jgi:hypothetical protein